MSKSILWGVVAYFFVGVTQIWAYDCETAVRESVEKFTELSVWSFESGVTFTQANGVTITGGDIYPLKYIRKNLLLSDTAVSEIRAQGESVLLVAEGFSELLPFFIAKGIEVKALDLWYDVEIPANYFASDQIAFIRNHQSHLISGDARHLPESVGQPDRYYSHMLVNNIPKRDILQVIDHAIRVTKKHISIFGFEYDMGAPRSGEKPQLKSGPRSKEVDLDKDHEGLMDSIRSHLDHHSSGKVRAFEFQKITQEHRGYPSAGFLLKIELN